MQLTVSTSPTQAYEGKVQDKADRIESAVASELIYFGKALSQSNTVAIGEVTPTVQMYTASQKFAGIAIADPSIEAISTSYGGYIATDTVPRIMKGRIWVKSGDTVDDLSKSVFVRSANAAGTAGYQADSTTYPVTTQAGLTSLMTIDGGTQQTVTFTTAIDQGNITDTTAWPLGDQVGLTVVITIDGGTPQTLTIAGTTTTAAHMAAEITALLVGGSAAVVGGQVVVTSNSLGPASAVAATAGTGGTSWAAGATVNNAAGIASEMNAQLDDCAVSVATSQLLVTSDLTGSTSSVLAAAGTGGLTWAAAVAGTGDLTTPPGNSRGSFRAVTTTGYTDLGAIADVKWVAGATIGGSYFGLIAINEG